MTLKTQITADDASFYNTDEYAEYIIYTPKNGESQSVKAHVIRDAPFQEPYVRGSETATCEIMIAVSDISNINYGDTFTLNDSEIWELDPSNGVIYRDDYDWTILLERRLD